MNYLLIGLGGILGALARYLAVKNLGRWQRGDFPLGTLVVNITGSFLIGLLGVGAIKAWLGPLFPAVVPGFLGAYTTFSTFSYEMATLLEEKNYATAIKYALTSITGGILATLIAIALIKEG